MAGELSLTVSLSFEKSGRKASASKSFSVDVSGDKFTDIIQEIGTSEEAVDIGDIGTAGWCYCENLDSTNYVEIRPGSGVADLIKVEAGEACLFRLTLNGPYAIANTAACDCRFVIIED